MRNKLAQSAIEYLTTYGWALLIIAVVFAVLFEMGVFNANTYVTTSCIFPAGINCMSAVLYAVNSTISVNIGQSLSYPINITAIGCNNKGTTTDMIPPNNPPSNQITLEINANATFSAYCYQNGSIISINPGGVYKGYVIVNYTNLQSGFPHTTKAQLVAKAA